MLTKLQRMFSPWLLLYNLVFIHYILSPGGPNWFLTLSTVQGSIIFHPVVTQGSDWTLGKADSPERCPVLIMTMAVTICKCPWLSTQVKQDASVKVAGSNKLL